MCLYVPWEDNENHKDLSIRKMTPKTNEHVTGTISVEPVDDVFGTVNDTVENRYYGRIGNEIC
jgi:hypothetical protein